MPFNEQASLCASYIELIPFCEILRVVFLFVFSGVTKKFVFNLHNHHIYIYIYIIIYNQSFNHHNQCTLHRHIYYLSECMT